MIPTNIKADVGIIVGRFQVPELHEAHVDLIQSVIDRHSKVIVFLGLSPCKVTANNPLDFESRKQLLLQRFPELIVLYIKDECSNESWSKRLDTQVHDLLGANQTALLYGSRDSFIKYYTGKFPVMELESTRIISGTEIRKKISNKVKASPDFRAGVIWSVGNQYKSCLPTVDVAIIDRSKNRILLAKKPGETKYRFVGGFASVDSTSYEADAKREVLEETGLEVDNLQYIGSCLIKDWRYESEQNKIKTLFYTADYIFGCPIANDDISEVKWFDTTSVTMQDVVEEHIPLMRMLYINLNLTF